MGSVASAPVVLVVEDEPLLRIAAADLFEDAGFDVLEAANADEAIKLLELRDDIRLVFTDIQMPGSLDGLKLAACVRDRWPPIEIIVTSGRVDRQDVHLPARSVFVPKPYDREEVVAIAQQMAA